MDDATIKAKRLIRENGPTKLLDSIWSKYRTVVPKKELGASVISSPERLLAIQREHAAANDEQDFLSFAWLRRRLAEVNELALQPYFAVIADDHVPAFGTLEENYRALIDAIITVSVRANVELGYWIHGRYVIDSDYGKLLDRLQERPAFQIRLDSGEKTLVFFIERWHLKNQVLSAPRLNPITRQIYIDSPSARAFLETPGKELRELYPLPLLEDCTFEIDVVYTWVNSEDPDWRAMLAEHQDQPLDATEGEVDSDRFLSRDELRYSLRSLLKNAPWVRQIHIASNCKPPEWFDETNDRVRWVYHEEFIDPEYLPTFSSHAIETSLHKIPDLSEHFLYFNDDIFVLKPIKKSDFFLPNGLAKIRPEAWGKVHGELDSEHPDYMNAARNVQALLQEEFGKVATRLHTHTPQSMKVSVVEACETMFKEAYEQTRSNKFRSITDISPSSFMYPNFAYLTGEAVMDYPKTSLLNARHRYKVALDGYLELLALGRFDDLPLTVCINDGGGSTTNEEWSDIITGFMQAAFDEMSEAEKGYEGPS